MLNKENGFKLNEEELEKVSGGREYSKLDPPLHKVGEKFTTDYFYFANRPRYGVITEVLGFLDIDRGYQYRYATFYCKDNSPSDLIDTTTDYCIEDGQALMSNYRIIK